MSYHTPFAFVCFLTSSNASCGSKAYPILYCVTMVTHRYIKPVIIHNLPLGSSEASGRNISLTIQLWRAMIGVSNFKLISSYTKRFNLLALRPSAWELCSIIQSFILAASTPGEKLQLSIAVSSLAISNFRPFQTEHVFPCGMLFQSVIICDL